MKSDSGSGGRTGKGSKDPTVEDDLRDEFIEWCHQFVNTFDGSDSWFDSSSSTLNEYWECRGNPQLSWKEGGYRMLIDILTVCISISRYLWHKVFARVRVRYLVGMVYVTVHTS